MLGRKLGQSFPDTNWSQMTAKIQSQNSGGAGDKKRDPAVEMASGAFAGALARLISAPLDMLKIRFQLQDGVVRYKSLYQAFSRIIKEEGAASLWKGNLSATYLWVSYSVVQFGVYGALKDAGKAIERDYFDGGEHTQQRTGTSASALNNAPSPYNSQLKGSKESKDHAEVAAVPAFRKFFQVLFVFLAGAGAGMLATTATYPLDLMRTQFAIQGNNRIFPSMRSFVTDRFQKDGVRGFYAGLKPAVWGITPYMGLNFALFEVTKGWSRKLDAMKNDREESPLSPAASAFASGLCGGLSGSVSKMVVYPLDVVKKKMQRQVLVSSFLDADKLGGALSAPRYKGMTDCIRQTFRSDGFAGFYKGLSPTLLKSFVGTAVTFGAYEFMSEMLMKERAKREKRVN